jgi:hypothetical protein
VASRDWIKKDYITKEVPCPLILDATKIVYPYQSTDVFRDESVDTVLIQNRRQFISDVGIFDVAVAYPFSLWLPFGAIAES